MAKRAVVVGAVFAALFAAVLAACGGESSGSGAQTSRHNAHAFCAVEATAPTAIVKGPDPYLGNPTRAKHDFGAAARFFDRAAAAAPDAIRGDVQTLGRALHRVVTRLAAVHYDVTKLHPPYTQTLSTSEVKTATDRIEHYIDGACPTTTTPTT